MSLGPVGNQVSKESNQATEESNQVNGNLDTKLRHSDTNLDTNSDTFKADSDTKVRHSDTGLDSDSDTKRPKITNKQRDIINFCSVPRSSKEILERAGVTYIARISKHTSCLLLRLVILK